MYTIVCNRCKQVIEEDDIEAVELSLQKKAYNHHETDFKALVSDEKFHFCGNCFMLLCCEWL